jgi:cell division protein FtsZ
MNLIEFQMPKNQNSIIKVIGVGGGGGNAVNNMYLKGIKGVDFIVCNTDLQALEMSPVPNKIRLGINQTEGLGAGANPETGKASAIESLDQIRDVLRNNTKMVFVTAGMGGGTGTGAAPVIAGLAKEMGILTVAIVTTPFKFEGRKRMAQAQEGIKELERNVDTIVTINNDNLTQLFGSNVTMKKAFEEADSVLCDAAKGIAEIITREGYINVDFADVNTIMKDGGTALMGTATYEGDDRAIRAAQDAISSPLLENINIHGSRGILVNICAAEDSLRLDETNTIVEYIQDAAGDNADIIFGTVYDDAMGNSLTVTVIATGFDKDKRSFSKDTTVRTVLDVQSDRNPYSQPTPEPPKRGFEDFSIGSSPTFEFDLDQFRQVPKQPAENVMRPRDEQERPQSERPQPRPQPQMESPEERLRKLRSTDYNYHNMDSLRRMEEVPAYLRKKVELDEEATYQPTKLSRMSLEEVDETYFTLSDNNSYLHDNVD